MLKIMLEKWEKNNNLLKKQLEERTDLNECGYIDLVKMTFETIFNTDQTEYGSTLDIEKMTEIDNGDYQGTLLYIIPFNVYQPSEYEYLITYVNYGSCSGCDTLLAIQGWSNGKLTKTQVKDFMSLCKDLICNTTKPYNGGWRFDDRFDEVQSNTTQH